MTNRRLALALLLAPLATATPLCASAQAAELIVTNARIHTVDENRPLIEAMAIRDGRVVATGPQRAIMTLRGPNTQVLDLHGRTVIPGMIDSHVHLLNLGNGCHPPAGHPFSSRSWPRWRGASCAVLEMEVGSLAPGKLADFVVLDQDIMRVPPELILGTNVLATYLGGRAVFQKPVQ